jgi:hypothetical protein
MAGIATHIPKSDYERIRQVGYQIFIGVSLRVARERKEVGSIHDDC